ASAPRSANDLLLTFSPSSSTEAEPLISQSLPRAAKRPDVAAPQGQPVGVVALEQELRGAAADAEGVAEGRKRDLGQAREQLAAAVVRRDRHGVAVADPAQAALLLEEGGELLVADLRDLLLGELRLELGGGLCALAERGGCARQVRLRTAALDLEQVEHVRRPRLVRQQLRELHPGIERVRPGAL